MRRAVFVLSVLAVTCLASDARAQSEAAIGLGLAVTSYDPTGALGQSATSIGPLIRIKMGPGLGPSLGFDWYAVGVNAMVAGQPVYVGRVSVKPVMAGLAYNYNRRKWWLSASIVGGYAFTGLSLNEGALPAFRSALNSRSLDFDVGNSLVFRPQLGVWYDAGPRVGVTASIAYIGVRPQLRVTGNSGFSQSTLQTACTVLTFGIVYGVF